MRFNLSSVITGARGLTGPLMESVLKKKVNAMGRKGSEWLSHTFEEVGLGTVIWRDSFISSPNSEMDLLLPTELSWAIPFWRWSELRKLELQWKSLVRIKSNGDFPSNSLKEIRVHMFIGECVCVSREEEQMFNCVYPASAIALTSAPASTKTEATCSAFLSTASCRGVTPWAFLTLTLAPDRISKALISGVE